MSCCNNRNCFGVTNSGCFVTSSSVVRPVVQPAAFYATLSDGNDVASEAEITLTTAPVVGEGFSFTAPGTTVSINKTGLYQINYSTTASSTTAGSVEVGLKVNGTNVTSTIQTNEAEENDEVALSGNYMLNVTTVPTTVAMYNAGSNATKYTNPQLSIVKIG